MRLLRPFPSAAPPALALALVAGFLSACGVAGSQTSPAWAVCKGAANGPDALQRKVSACTALMSGSLEAGDLAQALKSRGDGYRALAQYDLADADDTRAIGLDRLDSQARSDRGLTRYDQNRIDLALADFDEALRLDPDNAEALNGRAYAERRKGDDLGAIRDAGRAIELKPDWSGPWLGRGLAYLDEGWRDMALADFVDALRLDRGLVDAFDGVGEAQARKGDKSNAVTAYLEASSLDLDRKAYAEAVSETDKAVTVSPNDPGALNGRCWARAIADVDLDRAETDCLRSLAAKPRAGETLDSLAFLRFRQGRFDAALQGFGAALTQNPNQTESLYMRGLTKLRLGDADGGQTDIQAAQSKDPSIAARYANWGVTPE